MELTKHQQREAAHRLQNILNTFPDTGATKSEKRIARIVADEIFERKLLGAGIGNPVGILKLQKDKNGNGNH